VAAYTALLVAVFPSIESSPDFERLVESYPDALKSLFGLSGDFTTGPGYLDAELFSLMLPLLAIVLAVGSAARALAGEEDAGRLELVLAYPVRRRDAVVAKALAVAAEVALFCLAAFVALAVADPIVGLELGLGKLAAGVGGVGLVALCFGWLGLAVASLAPSRALAIGVPAPAAAASYLVGGLHELAGWLDPFRVLSPFWLVGQSPLRSGVDPWGALAVGVATVAWLGAAALLLERRDLQTP
jgi:ABC-2 type transport system permease protein